MNVQRSNTIHKTFDYKWKPFCTSYKHQYRYAFSKKQDSNSYKTHKCFPRNTIRMRMMTKCLVCSPYPSNIVNNAVAKGIIKIKKKTKNKKKNENLPAVSGRFATFDTLKLKDMSSFTVKTKWIIDSMHNIFVFVKILL